MSEKKGEAPFTRFVKKMFGTGATGKRRDENAWTKRISAWIVVGGLSVIFISQFGGPQSRGCTEDTGPSYAATVEGQTVPAGEFRAIYGLFKDGLRISEEAAQNLRLREIVMDGLVERELLANEARAIGLTASEQRTYDRLFDRTLLIWRATDGPRQIRSSDPRFRVGIGDPDRPVDAKLVQDFVRHGLRRSTGEFALWQMEEDLANQMRMTLAAGVAVSPEEIWGAYVREKERVTLEYIQFSPLHYQDRAEPTDADLTAWMAANTARMNTEWETRRARYQNLEKQVRTRRVLLRVESSATPEAKAAVRARAEALLARVRGGEDFAAVAREASEDEQTARRGGDLGYFIRGQHATAYDDQAFTLQPGQLSGIIETPLGFEFLRVEGIREGNVPEAEARREIATEMYREERAAQLAREAADRAQAALRAGRTMAEVDAELNPPVAPEAGTPPPESESPYAPRRRETEPFPRGSAPIPGGFDSAPLARAAYDLTSANPLGREPLRLGTDYFVFRLKERVDPTRAELTAEVTERIGEGLLRAKQDDILAAHVRRLRETAQRNGDIRRNTELLRYGSGSDASE